MNQNLVIIKGSNKGLCIHIGQGKFEIIKQQLELKLSEAKDFFKGGKVVSFKGRRLTTLQKQELKCIINEKYGLDVDVKELKLDEINKNKFKIFSEQINEDSTKFIWSTVRSGQRIKCEGSVVIIGDVNSGALIEAGGNIIIFGSLRGIAHAGNDGNRSSVIAAFRILSKQLRIADIIARAPDGEQALSKVPEVAKIKDGVIVIETYIQKKVI